MIKGDSESQEHGCGGVSKPDCMWCYQAQQQLDQPAAQGKNESRGYFFPELPGERREWENSESHELKENPCDDNEARHGARAQVADTQNESGDETGNETQVVH